MNFSLFFIGVTFMIPLSASAKTPDLWLPACKSLKGGMIGQGPGLATIVELEFKFFHLGGSNPSNGEGVPQTSQTLNKLKGQVASFCENPTQVGAQSLGKQLNDVGSTMSYHENELKYVSDHGMKSIEALKVLSWDEDKKQTQDQVSSNSCGGQIKKNDLFFSDLHAKNKATLQSVTTQLKQCSSKISAK